eukprot:gene39123-47600_t
MRLDIEDGRGTEVEVSPLLRNLSAPPVEHKYAEISYVAWGVVQEYLMTTEYKLGRFKSSQFCVFANRFLALIISLIIVLVRRATNPGQALKEAPFYYYVPSSLSNTLSSWAQYEALKF